ELAVRRGEAARYPADTQAAPVQPGRLSKRGIRSAANVGTAGERCDRVRPPQRHDVDCDRGPEGGHQKLAGSRSIGRKAGLYRSGTEFSGDCAPTLEESVYRRDG